MSPTPNTIKPTSTQMIQDFLMCLTANCIKTLHHDSSGTKFNIHYRIEPKQSYISMLASIVYEILALFHWNWLLHLLTYSVILNKLDILHMNETLCMIKYNVSRLWIKYKIFLKPIFKKWPVLIMIGGQFYIADDMRSFGLL